MRFLVDANMSPRVALLLRAAGHDAIAVRDVNLHTAADELILDHALADERIILSNDSDFGMLLAFRRLTKPSFILIRSSDPLTPDQQTALVLANLEVMAEDLTDGAIVTLARGRLRVRRLPLP